MKDILNWVSNSHWAVKLFIAISFLIIICSMTLIVFVNNEMSKGKTKPAQLQQNRPLSAVEYENLLVDQYDKWKLLSERVTYLLHNAKPGDQKWFTYVSIQVTQMKMLVNKAYQINPPYEHEVAHKSYMRAVDEFSWVSDNVLKSITEKNSKLSNTCLDRLQKGNEQLDYSMQRIEQGL